MRIPALLVLVAAVVAQEEQAPALPDDPKAVVITLDERGGFGPELPPEPRLEVLVDGTLKSYGKVVGALTKEEVSALVRYVVEEQRFFEWDRAKVDAKIGKDGTVAVLDASTVSIRVALKDRKHEAKVYALGWMAQQHPKVEDLQRLDRVRRRLALVRFVAILGGKKKATAFLDLANKALVTEHPEVDPFAMGDLAHAAVQDGVLVCRFHRAAADGAWTSAFVKVPKDGDPVVSVEAGP